MEPLEFRNFPAPNGLTNFPEWRLGMGLGGPWGQPKQRRSCAEQVRASTSENRCCECQTSSACKNIFPRTAPRRPQAVRGIENGCKAMIVRNQKVSPWPGVARLPTSSVRRLSLPQDVGARDKPGQGVFGGKIRSKTLVQLPLSFRRTAPRRPGARAG